MGSTVSNGLFTHDVKICQKDQRYRQQNGLKNATCKQYLRWKGNRGRFKPCDANNGIHGTKWRCLHFACACVFHAENGLGTHSLHVRLHHHRLNTKLDANVDTDAHAKVTCKQSFTLFQG